MITAAAQGFGIGLGLIMPIGLQNAWILKRGISRNYPVISATICATCDALLVTIGVFGGGQLFSKNESLLTAMTIAGVIFLLAYSFSTMANSVRLARQTGYFKNRQFSGQPGWQKKNKTSTPPEHKPAKTLKLVIAGTLAVTLLNPHVYLDTVVMLGSIAANYDTDQRTAFATGSIAASVFWFYILCFFAIRLAPVLNRPASRCAIDFVCSILMASIAVHLVLRLIN